LAFTFRDLTQEWLGRKVVLVAIVVGALLSWLVTSNRDLAVASGVAFLFSELADFAVYQPLRERRWLLAVAASNLVGLVIDSVLFLQIAFAAWTSSKVKSSAGSGRPSSPCWCCWHCAAGSFRATAARPTSQPCRRSPRPARQGRRFAQRGPPAGRVTRSPEA